VRGIVACPEPLAAEAGAAIIHAGGNAMDAAVAAAFAQCVVDPLHCGIAGVGVLVGRSGTTGEISCIRFWGPIGSRATPDVFATDLIEARPGEPPKVRGRRNRAGHQSVVVPGFVRGMAEAYRTMGSGRVSWQALLQPAARFARDGFIVDDYVERYWAPDGLNLEGMTAQERLSATPASAAIYLNNGRPYRAGERLVQADLARTLDRLGAVGADDFYEGEIGRRIADDFAAHQGFLTAEDLSRYRPLQGEPLWGSYRGLTIATDPPPGSGALVIELLNILEDIDLESMGWNSPRYQDTLARAMRYVFADRANYMADPRFHPVPTAMLTSKAYAAEIRRRVMRGQNPDRPETDLAVGEKRAPDGTTHVSVLDGDGNAAAITHTNHDASGVVVPGLGFLFNNDMNSFDPVPGRLNSIGPGKAPVTGGAPTLFMQGRDLVMVIGSPAGPLKVTAVVQAVLSVTRFGMSIADAVAADRIHCEGDAIVLEPSFPADQAEELRKLGNSIVRNGYTARLAAIYREPRTGRYEGGTDPRGGGGLAIVE
jgi:gamma-glutamyltranspeptidase/glutathione hydrolase